MNVNDHALDRRHTAIRFLFAASLAVLFLAVLRPAAAKPQRPERAVHRHRRSERLDRPPGRPSVGEDAAHRPVWPRAARRSSTRTSSRRCAIPPAPA